MADTATAGEIEYSGGWVFKWLLQGETTPEVWGSVQAPNGSLVKASSGFYRTHLPFKAAAYARAFIGGETYY